MSNFGDTLRLLQTETEELVEYAISLKGTIKEQQKTIDTLTKALEFYADGKYFMDDGFLAKTILEELESK